MNDNQEKAKLWKTYSIFIGVMLGGTVIVLCSQFVWNSIQQQSSSQLTEKSANSLTDRSDLSKTDSSQTSSNLQQYPSTISRPSVNLAVQDYYLSINNRQYQTTWNFLASELKNNPVLHPQGFNSFLEWWQTVEKVEILKFTDQETTINTAQVDAQLQYYMKSGRKISQSLRFFFVWDTSQKDG